MPLSSALSAVFMSTKSWIFEIQNCHLGGSQKLTPLFLLSRIGWPLGKLTASWKVQMGFLSGWNLFGAQLKTQGPVCAVPQWISRFWFMGRESIIDWYPIEDLGEEPCPRYSSRGFLRQCGWSERSSRSMFSLVLFSTTSDSSCSLARWIKTKQNLTKITLTIFLKCLWRDPTEASSTTELFCVLFQVFHGKSCFQTYIIWK